MPMTDEQRRAYLQRAGVTQEQIDVSVGELPIHEPTLQKQGVARYDAERARDDAERARDGIHQVMATISTILAKHSAAGDPARTYGDVEAGASGVAAIDADELETDRRLLDELYVDEFILFNGSGDALNKAQTIDGILKRTINLGTGLAGWKPVNQSLRVYGDIAIVFGAVQLEGKGRAIDTETGEVHWRDLRGLRWITASYLLQDNQWKKLHTQMTPVPADRDWRLANVEEVGPSEVTALPD